MRKGIRAVLSDLDGTLLPMDQDVFTKAYFAAMAGHMQPFGYDAEQLTANIWKATAAMVNNDGTMTNEKRFWSVFESLYGNISRSDIEQFDLFYRDHFRRTKSAVGCDPAAAETVKKIKAAGYRLILATNPIFPSAATLQRIEWAGLDADDFELITTYENSSFCKPDVKYYEEILAKTGLSGRECVMIGNDAGEDLPASELGMDVFLLTKDLINTRNIDISGIPQGGFADLQKWLGLC